MICKFCGKEMEYDSSEGISYAEKHKYMCECGTSLIRSENLEEDIWIES